MMKRIYLFRIFLLLTVVNILVLSPARATSSSRLTVQLNGLKNQKGQVCFSLFSSSQGFPAQEEQALQSRCVQLAETHFKTTFENLIPGGYAVAVFHDANGDRILNVNPLGIPTEGFGFSRNPQILAGPPNFGETVVTVAPPQNNIQIQLQYLLNWN